MSRQSELHDAYGRARRRPAAGGILQAVAVPCVLYIGLQFIGLMLHIIGAAHSGPAGGANLFGTLGSVCSVVAWLVLLVGLVRLVVKLSALVATRSKRRLARKQ
jgi:hypothetical protein